MSQQYRSMPPPCPLCGSSMEDRAAVDAVVDVCTECHAVWIDWFDGDIATVASEIEVVRTIPAHVSDKHPCPRCRTELVSERLYQTGPFVLRCSDCSGVLVPSAVLKDVVELGPSEQRGAPIDTNPITRMLAKLRKVFSATSA
jgi:Zn-finger nucleic acid-binding protein